MVCNAHDFIVRIDVGDVLAKRVLVLVDILSSVTEVEADAIVPVVPVKGCQFIFSIVILDFLFLLKSTQIFHLQPATGFVLFLFLLEVQPLEFKLLVQGIVYSSRNDFYANGFFWIHLHRRMKIGLAKARADVQESRSFAL